MDVGESILDSIDEELSFEDVEMMEVEEGEVVDGHTSGETHTTHINHKQVNMNSHCAHSNTKITNNMAKRRKNKKKKKNKKNKVMPSSDAVNIDKFVLGVCKQLREPKSYLVYTAVGVLGVSALRDLLREVILTLNSHIKIFEIIVIGAYGDALYILCALYCLQVLN